VKSALLYQTHLWSSEIEAQFDQLTSLDEISAWLLLDSRTPTADMLVRRYARSYVFDLDRLFRLPYPRIKTPGLIGHAHFPILEFYLSHPDYDHYWFVEYDVRYTGDWNSLTSSFAPFDQDFIATHIRKFADEPRWCWWETFGHPSKKIAQREWIRSFNVIYRISNRALSFLHREIPTGWRGHHEALVTTVLHHYGFTLLDFGGDGPFVPPELRNKTYTSYSSKDGRLSNNAGTVRYRPPRDKCGPLKNKIYHPVKPKRHLAAIACLRLGHEYLEAENWSCAKEAFEKYSELNTEDSMAPYNVALCLTRLGHYREAAGWYEEALRRDPNLAGRQDIVAGMRLPER
jgi:hypothetical protein